MRELLGCEDAQTSGRVFSPLATKQAPSASRAAERGDGNLPGYLRIEYYDPWMVPVPGPGVEMEHAPVPVVPAVTYPFSGSGPGWKRWCGKGWEEGGSQGARGRDTWQGHVRARASRPQGRAKVGCQGFALSSPGVRWGIRGAWAAAGPGSCGAGGRGEARPRTVPVCAGRGPEPGHWAVKPRSPPSLLSAARGPVPSVVELPTRLSLAVPASLVSSPRTPSDGRIPPVGTPCQLTGAETDGRGWRPGGPRG
ncbi:protein CXorf40B homolog isoform X2 [Neophocaena asiaeorientalis asiaeorientalis]|uniref:Protein CXorf40B homolog isoform X2 n=1 Tax=Neophocaena asiaeorientalis asiaeorientalis TaxID=1706337 RepID=A0A341B3V6_NEOAA|nr:protein CXorf40B homolog isoform X2 [Neophocaena asiaeorientalis asiaeorientalis]